MKILQLIQRPQFRGAELFATQLGNGLIGRGHECLMVTLFEGDADLPFTGRLIKLDRPGKKRLFDRAGWRELARIVAEERPDVIQANAGDTLKFAIFSKLFNGWSTPVIFRNANKIGDFIDTKPKYWFNKFFVNRLSHVISVSELCRQDFVATFRYPSDRIDMVQIGIDLRTVGGVPQDVAAIFARGPVLVNVASLVREKNHVGLLRIFSRLAGREAAAQLVIVGKGALGESLKQEVARLGLSDRVHFLGARKDVLEIIQAAQVFVLPSIIEGLPGVILEAQYCKTPVVAYDVGGISEVVRSGATGWLVPKGDEAAFEAAVGEVLGGGASVDTIVDGAHAQVLERFDNRVIAQRFETVYQRVIARG